jgi:hypothetical protein
MSAGKGVAGGRAQGAGLRSFGAELRAQGAERQTALVTQSCTEKARSDTERKTVIGIR